MPPAWSGLLFRLVVAVLAGLTFGFIFDAAAGFAAAAAVLAALLVAHTVRLARLLDWLRSPAERELPEVGGVWGEVFIGLHRLQRGERQARGRLEAELEVFSQAAEASPDGLVILDAEERIAWCNRMAEQHLGLSAARDVGLPLTNLVRIPRFAEFLVHSAPGEELRFSDGGRALSLEVIRFGADRKLLISFDVTQVERAETVRRDFVANVSHELRTPLTVICGFLEHMVEDAAPEMRPQLAMMDEQARRMLHLVSDLLTLSKLEDETQTPAEELFDVRDLLYDVAADTRQLSAGKHSITCEAQPAFLKGSREELRSAFANLASNAVRYTPEGGRILLSWALREGQGVFSVEDSGIGIPEEHLPRLTERFYRVDRGRSRESGGTGLGLAIVKHVLMRHQAGLEIRSVPGAGSTFGAVFPAWRVRPLGEGRS